MTLIPRRVGDQVAARVVGVQLGAAGAGAALVPAGVGLLLQAAGTALLAPCLVVGGAVMAALHLAVAALMRDGPQR